MSETLLQSQSQTHTKLIQYHGTTCTMKIKIRHDDQCGNGHHSFSITGEIYTGKICNDRTYQTGGCIHDEIRKYFPEFAHLIQWHLTSTDGPMHYLANVLYLASDRDCWGRRKGDPSRWETRIRFNDSAISHPIKQSFADFLEASRVEDLHICKYSHDDRKTFGDHYTFGGFGAAWHECPFKSQAEADEWLEALQSEPFDIYHMPTAFSEGKQPELESARKAAIWPDATLEQLTDEVALRERLPELLERFRNDVEALGFTY